MLQYAWLIPVFPLLAFVLLTIFGKRLQANAAYLGMLALAASLGMAVLTLITRLTTDTYTYVIDWLTIGGLPITMGFEITALNAMMLVIVTTVSFLVHVFSRGYMAGDARISVFYAYLGLFTFSMLGLVLAPNILQLFIFWELVGLSSFLLIGFWYFKPEAAAAAKKAFITTRIGDVGLLIGLVLTFIHTGSFDYGVIFATINAGLVDHSLVTIIALLIFLGAVGKSAQFPLHVWLPDAMEGPTPVSALIHAATMVAAGVYLVAVMYPVFIASGTALTVVAYTGAITAIFAATIALVQNDIKRVLAFSTVSQLGFMMLALGTLGYVAGLFHLMTHAFFKALLFLGAGSVIHAVGSQDIREMGGLWKKLPVTGATFLIGALAIAGVPPLAGFWSKDEIFASVWANGDGLLFTIAVVSALMTAFYMFRLFFMTFTGSYRGAAGIPDARLAGQRSYLDPDAAILPTAFCATLSATSCNASGITSDYVHTHSAKDEAEIKESSIFMTLPLVMLATMALVAGLVNAPFTGHALSNFLMAGMDYGAQALASAGMMAVSVLIALTGIFFAWLIYVKEAIAPAKIVARFESLHYLFYNKYFIDEIYQKVFIQPLTRLATASWQADDGLIDKIVNRVASTTQATGNRLVRIQNGQVQTYGLVTLIGGMVVFVAAFVLRGYIG